MFELAVHLPGLVLHPSDLSFPGSHFTPEVLYLVVEHVLELLQLPVLLLQVINPALLLPNRAVALPDLTRHLLLFCLKLILVLLLRRQGFRMCLQLVVHLVDLLLQDFDLLVEDAEVGLPFAAGRLEGVHVHVVLVAQLLDLLVVVAFELTCGFFAPPLLLRHLSLHFGIALLLRL
jgi:hypothetical protein